MPLGQAGGESATLRFAVKQNTPRSSLQADSGGLDENPKPRAGVNAGQRLDLADILPLHSGPWPRFAPPGGEGMGSATESRKSRLDQATFPTVAPPTPGPRLAPIGFPRSHGPPGNAL